MTTTEAIVSIRENIESETAHDHGSPRDNIRLNTNNMKAKKLGITRFAQIEEVNMTVAEAIVSTREGSKA